MMKKFFCVVFLASLPGISLPQNRTELSYLQKSILLGLSISHAYVGDTEAVGLAKFGSQYVIGAKDKSLIMPILLTQAVRSNDKTALSVFLSLANPYMAEQFSNNRFYNTSLSSGYIGAAGLQTLAALSLPAGTGLLGLARGEIINFKIVAALAGALDEAGVQMGLPPDEAAWISKDLLGLMAFNILVAADYYDDPQAKRLIPLGLAAAAESGFRALPTLANLYWPEDRVTKAREWGHTVTAFTLGAPLLYLVNRWKPRQEQFIMRGLSTFAVCTAIGFWCSSVESVVKKFLSYL